MLQLKDYQQESLAALEAYFKRCTHHEEGRDDMSLPPASEAFREVTHREHGRPLPYQSVNAFLDENLPEMAELPYVCLRVPTGGGKTLMACHAIGRVERELMQADRAVVLWLVPSNAILEQTLAALKDRSHPYRQAVEASVDGSVRVLDIGGPVRQPHHARYEDGHHREHDAGIPRRGHRRAARLRIQRQPARPIRQYAA
jgi:type III restriction enzyme